MEEENDSFEHQDDNIIVDNSITDNSITNSSSLKNTYSVNSESEYNFMLKSIEKSGKKLTYVQKMKLKFEHLSSDEQFRLSPKVSNDFRPWRSNPGSQFGLNEVLSADELDGFVSDSEENSNADKHKISINAKKGIHEAISPKLNPILVNRVIDDHDLSAAIDKDESGDVNSIEINCRHKNIIKDIPFTSRYSEPLRRKKVIYARHKHAILKTQSYYHRKKESSEDEKISASDSFDSDFDPDNVDSSQKPHAVLATAKEGCTTDAISAANAALGDETDNIPQIVKEFIYTEQKYVETLKQGIQQYCGIFTMKNLPATLRGKNFILFGNIDQIAEFHETVFLPMLHKNKNDIAQLCEEFQKFIEDDYFYVYVLYTINKTRSEKLCIQHKEYFHHLQNEIGDKLGINSFLVQPIQRLPRYCLLLNEMISKFFKSDPVKYKKVLASCCKVEKNVRNLLKTVNEAMQVNDIEDCNDINILYQGHFRKCDEFYIYDYTLRRGYRSKVFIFDRCLVYTEIIKDNRLVFRGCYPCDRIGFISSKKSFTLYYQKRKVQECDFAAEQIILDLWHELITDMIRSFADDEKRKLKEKYNKFNQVYRRPGSITLLRNSSIKSNDSGIASMLSTISISASPSPVGGEKRTTWYTDKLVD